MVQRCMHASTVNLGIVSQLAWAFNGHSAYVPLPEVDRMPRVSDNDTGGDVAGMCHPQEGQAPGHVPCAQSMTTSHLSGVLVFRQQCRAQFTCDKCQPRLLDRGENFPAGQPHARREQYYQVLTPGSRSDRPPTAESIVSDGGRGQVRRAHDGGNGCARLTPLCSLRSVCMPPRLEGHSCRTGGHTIECCAHTWVYMVRPSLPCRIARWIAVTTRRCNPP